MSAQLPRLPDINDVEPVTGKDDAIFEEIRETLTRHGALTRFGVTLLHQHFEMADNEVLVEHIDVDNRILTNRPFAVEQFGNAIETSWRLDDPTAQRRCETLCVQDRDAEGRPYHRRQHYTTS